MARVKNTSSTKHRKLKKAARGFKQARRSRLRVVKEALLHAGKYAYIGRRLRKRDLRKLWITRLGAAAREEGISYSKLIAGLKKENIDLDRKMLAEIAVSDPDTFKAILKKATSS